MNYLGSKTQQQLVQHGAYLWSPLKPYRINEQFAIAGFKVTLKTQFFIIPDKRQIQ